MSVALAEAVRLYILGQKRDLPKFERDDVAEVIRGLRATGIDPLVPRNRLPTRYLHVASLIRLCQSGPRRDELDEVNPEVAELAELMEEYTGTPHVGGSHLGGEIAYHGKYPE